MNPHPHMQSGGQGRAGACGIGNAAEHSRIPEHIWPLCPVPAPVTAIATTHGQRFSGEQPPLPQFHSVPSQMLPQTHIIADCVGSHGRLGALGSSWDPIHGKAIGRAL